MESISDVSYGWYKGLKVSVEVLVARYPTSDLLLYPYIYGTGVVEFMSMMNCPNYILMVGGHCMSGVGALILSSWRC